VARSSLPVLEIVFIMLASTRHIQDEALPKLFNLFYCFTIKT